MHAPRRVLSGYPASAGFARAFVMQVAERPFSARGYGGVQVFIGGVTLWSRCASP